MKKFIVESYELVMDSRKNPLHHLDLASQHYIMQALGWMWSMVFSLSFLSVFHFHFVWGAHILMFGGICLKVFSDARNGKNPLRLQSLSKARPTSTATPLCVAGSWTGKPELSRCRVSTQP